jgi:membrane protease YdiL (CAAX protease family)
VFTSLSDPLVEAALNLAFGISFAAGALAANRRYRLNISSESLGPVPILASVAVGTALFAIALLVPAPPEGSAPPGLERRTAATVLTCISVLVVAPIWEELVFRGAVYELLRPRMGSVVAAGTGAVGFALVHVSYASAQWLALAAGGAALSALYIRARSIYAPILAHFVINLLLLLSL